MPAKSPGLVQVVYGRTTVHDAISCPRCKGKGQSETYFTSGVYETCPYCEGAGHTLKGTRAYTYRAAEPVALGDIVEVPGNRLNASPQEATVIAFGSDYDGPVSSIRRVVARA
jgi:RecJ-like exonuclease